MLLARLAGTAAVVTAVALLAVPAIAPAANRTQGTPMSLEPAVGSDAFGCDTIWLTGFPYQRTTWQAQLGINMTSCSAFSMVGINPDTGHFVPGPGTVTTVRVKSGANPAPLQVSIIKQLFQKNPDPPHQITDTICCTGTGRESAVFQPVPNDVTEYPANLPVTTTPSVNGSSGHQDIVAVSAVGPGDLPLASTGPHMDGGPTQPQIVTFYPKVPIGQQGDKWFYPNWVVLMNYDWTDGCATTAKVKASACQPPPPVNSSAPVTVSSKSLRLKKGKVAIKVNCTAAAGQSCKGNLKLSTVAKKPRLLAKKAINVAGGKSKTIKLKLSSKSQKRVKKKKNKVQVEIDLGAAGKATKALSLNR